MPTLLKLHRSLNGFAFAAPSWNWLGSTLALSTTGRRRKLSSRRASDGSWCPAGRSARYGALKMPQDLWAIVVAPCFPVETIAWPAMGVPGSGLVLTGNRDRHAEADPIGPPARSGGPVGAVHRNNFEMAKDVFRPARHRLARKRPPKRREILVGGNPARLGSQRSGGLQVVVPDAEVHAIPAGCVRTPKIPRRETNAVYRLAFALPDFG